MWKAGIQTSGSQAECRVQKVTDIAILEQQPNASLLDDGRTLPAIVSSVGAVQGSLLEVEVSAEFAGGEISKEKLWDV